MGAFGMEIGDDVEDMLAIDGDDDEVIDGMYDVGAGRARGRVTRAQAMRRQRNVAVLKQRDSLKPRNIWLGFPATSVASLAQGNMQTQPQVLFRPERLFVPSDIAGAFVIDQLIIGKDNQWAAAQPVPARAFQEDCFQNEDLGLDTAQPNSLITCLATNFSLATQTFRGALRGQSIQ